MAADGHVGYTKMAITSQPVWRSTWYLVLGRGFRLILDFCPWGLHTCAAVARNPRVSWAFLFIFPLIFWCMHCGMCLSCGGTSCDCRHDVTCSVVCSDDRWQWRGGEKSWLSMASAVQSTRRWWHMELRHWPQRSPRRADHQHWLECIHISQTNTGLC